MHIAIERLTKRYPGGITALNAVDLDIPPGMFGLLGANGAGKTTLMRILAGILLPTEGTAIVGGHDLTTGAGRRAVQQHLGYLPQELGLYPDLTAREFLDYIGILKGLVDTPARRRRIEDVLETVALAEAGNRKLKAFSGGMKRRVGIAQALLNDPRLLIVDEPTAGLDPEERIRFRTLLSELAGNRTVVLSTHIVEDVAQTSHALAVLNRGNVLFQGSAPDLVAAARGGVWTVTTEGEKPDGDVVIVSMVHLGSHVQYRVVGEPSPRFHVEPVPPNLEDGYVWLMRDHRLPVAGSTRRLNESGIG